MRFRCKILVVVVLAFEITCHLGACVCVCVAWCVASQMAKGYAGGGRPSKVMGHPTPKDVYKLLGVRGPTPKDVYKLLGV